MQFGDILSSKPLNELEIEISPEHAHECQTWLQTQGCHITHIQGECYRICFPRGTGRNPIWYIRRIHQANLGGLSFRERFAQIRRLSHQQETTRQARHAGFFLCIISNQTAGGMLCIRVSLLLPGKCESRREAFFILFITRRCATMKDREWPKTMCLPVGGK